MGSILFRSGLFGKLLDLGRVSGRLPCLSVCCNIAKEDSKVDGAAVIVSRSTEMDMRINSLPWQSLRSIGLSLRNGAFGLLSQQRFPVFGFTHYNISSASNS